MLVVESEGEYIPCQTRKRYIIRYNLVSLSLSQRVRTNAGSFKFTYRVEVCALGLGK